MSDTFGRHDGAPVRVSEEEEDRQREEKALAWLKAILRQEAKMITADSLERALNDAPEEEVADLLWQKVADLMRDVYYPGQTGQVKGSQDAVQVYLALVEASIGMTSHEFKVVEHFHHELVHHFSQLAMLKPKNQQDEDIIYWLQLAKQKFEAAQSAFVMAKESAVANETYEDEGEKMVENKRELSPQERMEIEELESSLSDLLNSEDSNEKLDQVLPALRAKGREATILSELQEQVGYTERLQHDKLEEYDQEMVRYTHENVRKQLAVIESLPEMTAAENELVEKLRALIALKLPVLERQVAWFDQDPASIKEHKIDLLRKDLDDALYDPIGSDFATFKEAIMGLHELGGGEKVLYLLESEIEYGTDLYSELTDKDQLVFFLKKADLLHDWLGRIDDVISVQEEVLVQKLDRLLLLKAENTKWLLAKIEKIEAPGLVAEQEKLLGLLKRHGEKLEVKPVEKKEKGVDVEQLRGRLYLFLAQADAEGLRKTVKALNKMGMQSVVMSELESVKARSLSGYSDYSSSKLQALRSITEELTESQNDFVDNWAEESKEHEVIEAKRREEYEVARVKRLREAPDSDRSLESWINYESKLAAKNEQQIVPAVETQLVPIVEPEMKVIVRERKAIVKDDLVNGLKRGDFGVLREDLEKDYGARWFDDQELKQAAQDYIDKQWPIAIAKKLENPKSKMLGTLEGFVVAFELKVPVIKKSRKK